MAEKFLFVFASTPGRAGADFAVVLSVHVQTCQWVHAWSASVNHHCHRKALATFLFSMSMFAAAQTIIQSC